MKFQASVVFDFRADSVAEAGKRLDRLIKDAAGQHDLSASVVELRTPPSDAATPPPVVLPPVTAPARTPGPQAREESRAFDPASN
jgi:hypothetical protein